ncbi:cation:proton antiporter [Bernardetia sp.]|uniref:cation:proton antiporter n=1 Tax=Bernardetia sp. TaxID=1937974 RepID=UPI0025C5BDE6|nr:sodium:proton antiporter [Bernardetia sp.]
MLQLAGLLVLGFLAQWLAWRIKVPAILPLIIVGLLVGPVSTLFTGDEGFFISKGPKLIDGDAIFQGKVLFDVVSLAVGLILFEGGLTLKLSEVKVLGKAVRNIIVIGSIVTMAGGTVAAMLIMDFSVQTALLFGSLIIVTGPTVIGPILRNVKPNFNITTILKWEGILIDPVGALIAILTYEFIISGTGGAQIGWIAFKTFAITIAVGIAIGWLMAWFVNFLIMRELIPKYLQNIVLLGLVIAAFALSNSIQHESGLLAVTIMGMALVNMKTSNLKEIISFNEDLVIILISFLFVLLSSRIDVVDIELVLTIKSFILFAVVVFVLRPLSVFLSTWGTNLTLKEKLFISYISPRGIVTAAVASIFSISLFQSKDYIIPLDEASMLLPLVFLVIVGTVVLQGLTAKPIAKLLGVTRKDPNGVVFLSADESARFVAKIIQKYNIPVLLADTSKANTREASMQQIPVYEGSILNEEAWEEVDFAQYGQLWAMTPNAEINALACRIVGEELDKGKVFRFISNREQETLNKDDYPKNILFEGRADFITFSHFIRKNPKIKEKQVNSREEVLSILDAVENKGKVIPLFVINDKNFIEPALAVTPLEVGKENTFVYLEIV